jgi:hypothetical protein
MSYRQSEETRRTDDLHAYGDTELLQRANIKNPLKENLCCGYSNLLSVT